jgi:hypothetical protein
MLFGIPYESLEYHRNQLFDGLKRFSGVTDVIKNANNAQQKREQLLSHNSYCLHYHN